MSSSENFGDETIEERVSDGSLTGVLETMGPAVAKSQSLIANH